MKCAYICWRPYQVFNALNLLYSDVEDSKNDSDLYIQDLPIMKNYVEQIQKLD